MGNLSAHIYDLGYVFLRPCIYPPQRAIRAPTMLGGAATAPAPFSLSTATLRNLGHKEYEKRKQAALEVRAPLPRTALRQPS